MRVLPQVSFALFAFAMALGTEARADSASAALDELKQGYALKQAGNCTDAALHFARSLELDPKPKSALNLADCEQRDGDLLSARDHAAMGRELAHRKHNAELTAIATELVTSVEKRLPKLTITVAANAPAATSVALDSVPVPTDSLGVAAQLNPGPHEISVAAPGRLDKTFSMTLVEASSQSIEVAPGEPVAPPRAPVVAEHKGSWFLADLGPRKTLALGAGGIGFVGWVVGISAGVAASAKHDALTHECNGTLCPASSREDLDGFRSLRTWSTAGYLVGCVAIATGAVLWLTAPTGTPHEASTKVGLGPGSVQMISRF